MPAGEITIVVRDAEFEEVRDRETVEANKATEVRYYLERTGFGDPVTVVGKRPRKEVVRRTLSVEEIRTIPGTSGDLRPSIRPRGCTADIIPS